MQVNIVCFYDNKIHLNSTPFYFFLNEVEKKEGSKEQAFLIKKNLEEIVFLINKRKLYYNPKIKTDLLNILQGLDKLENVKLRDVRRFQKSVSDFDSYLVKYIDNLVFFLNRNEKEFLGSIRLFNDQAIKLLQNQNFLKFSGLQKAGDFVFFRPLEFVVDNKSLFGSLLLVSGVLSSCFFLYSKAKKKFKKRNILKRKNILKSNPLILKNKNEVYNVTQIYVNKQREAECALHAVWNCFLGFVSDSVEQFRENEQKYLDDFYLWTTKIRKSLGRRNWFDDGAIEEIIGNKEMIPDFVEPEALENIRILRALPNGSEKFLEMHRGRLGREDVNEEVYLGVVEAEFDGSLKSFVDDETQNLILLINRHYVSLKLIKNDENPGGLEAWITNSFGNIDYTDNHGVNNVLSCYADCL